MTPKGKRFVVLADNSIVWIKEDIKVVFIDREEEKDGDD